MIGTTSTPEKAAIATAAGCDHVTLYTQQDVVAETKKITGGEGVNVVYDGVCYFYFFLSLFFLSHVIIPTFCCVFFVFSSRCHFLAGFLFSHKLCLSLLFISPLTTKQKKQVGKDTFNKSIDCLSPRGFMVILGNASGAVPPVDPFILSNKGAHASPLFLSDLLFLVLQALYL